MIDSFGLLIFRKRNEAAVGTTSPNKNPGLRLNVIANHFVMATSGIVKGIPQLPD
jgi:hypothetical protein